MSNSAVSGHGATFAITLDPVNSASTYTSIAEIVSDIMHEYSRDSEGHAAHGDTVVSYIMDGAFDQSEIPLTLNFIYNNSTHDHTTGVQAIFKAGTLIGFRLRAPAGAADTNEVIGSCFVSGFKRTMPNRVGAQSADVTFRPSGTFKIDGVTF